MKNKRKNAFTLVEMLVVIGTIAALLSILMPSLGRVRQYAYRLVCQTHLSQLALGWQMYSSDNDGFLCSPFTSKDQAPLNNNWVAVDCNTELNSDKQAMVENAKNNIAKGVLWPYIKDVEVYNCRSSNSFLSYAISYTMGGQRDPNDSMDGIKPFREYGEIDKPSQRLVFADAQTEQNLLCGPYWPIELDDGQLKFKPSGSDGQYMTDRHSSGTNFAFADLHCEYYKYKSRKTLEMLQNENESAYLNRYSQNNPDLNNMIYFLKGKSAK